MHRCFVGHDSYVPAGMFVDGDLLFPVELSVDTFHYTVSGTVKHLVAIRILDYFLRIIAIAGHVSSVGIGRKNEQMKVDRPDKRVHLANLLVRLSWHLDGEPAALWGQSLV